MGSASHSHVAVFAYPFSSHVPKLLSVARAIATAAPSATFSFLSTADTLARLPATGTDVPGNNLRYVEFPSGGDYDVPGTSAVRRMELFMEAAESGGFKRALEAAAAVAGGVTVSCVVGDAFMSMAAEAGVPWVPVWTGAPSALLPYLAGDKLRKHVADNRARGDDPFLTSFPGLATYSVSDLPFGGAGDRGEMGRIITNLLSRMGQRLPRATAVGVNAFPGLLAPDVLAALDSALPNCLPIGPYHLLPGATAAAAPANDDDPHGCLAWLANRPAGSVAYVSFGTIATPTPDELRELASGLEVSGAPFLWSLREDSWPLLPTGFLDRAKANSTAGRALVVPWTPQAAVLKHQAVGAFITHSGWGAIVEGISGGVPMVCRPFFGDQRMNACDVARQWCFGTAFGLDDGKPLTSGGVAKAVASLLTGEEEEARMMRARARELQDRMVKAFEPDGGSIANFHELVDIVCAHRV